MAKTQFLVTGMFRSGTTFCARVLSANRHIICASDPFAPIFKHYRNKFGQALLPQFDKASPLHDYYFDEFQNSLYHSIRSSSFDVELAPSSLAGLIDNVRQHSTHFSPLINSYLHNLAGKDFFELFHSGLRVIEMAYPKEHYHALGFKEVWTDEFAPHFLGLASNARVIHVVRDPRAVVASNYVSGARYPLLFLARQWRKLATLALVNAESSDRVKIIKYENLVSHLGETALEICSFLGVEFDEAMTRIGELKDGSNQPWYQNSSYHNAGMISQNAKTDPFSIKIERWRDVLPKEYLQLVEKLCCFEMKLFGYNFVTDAALQPQITDGLLFTDDSDFLANWVKPYSKYDYCREMLAENARHELIRSQTQVDTALKMRLALVPHMFEKLGFVWSDQPSKGS
jgi:hypothetical protein